MPRDFGVGRQAGAFLLEAMPLPVLRPVPGLFALLLLAAGPARAVNRVFTLEVPAAAAPGARIDVHIRMSTDAGEGEAIAFLQAEYSTDGGKTWTSAWAEQDLGTTSDRGFGFAVGAAGTTAKVRARVAYRGGVAGAVDCAGAAIRWYDTWKDWHEPPAKSASVNVR